MKYSDIKLGSRITFLIPGGKNLDGSIDWKEKRGKVAMKGPHGWVVNGGGRHGTPYVVNEENFVK